MTKPKDRSVRKLVAVQCIVLLFVIEFFSKKALGSVVANRRCGFEARAETNAV